MSDSKGTVARRIALTVLAFVGLALALLTAAVPPVQANPTQYGYFKVAYPSSPLSAFPNTGPHTGCLVCHPTTAGPKTTFPPLFFNSYGAAYDNAGSHATQVAAMQALRAIEALNSDDDGPIITVMKAGHPDATGTVWSSAGGFSCRTFPCTMSFSNSAGVVLNTASTCDGEFKGWSGGGTPACTGKGPCTVRADNRTEIDRGTLPGEPSSRPTIAVTATFDTNLCAAGFPGTPPPLDLAVTSLVASTVGTVGGTIQASATIVNKGTTTAPANRLEFFYSPDPTITTADTRSTMGCEVPSLGAGQSTSCSGPITVPSSLSPGTYHVGSVVDFLNQIPEIDELNNSRAADSGVITLVGGGTSPLRASLNKAQYAGDEPLSLTMMTQPTGVAVDFYLVFAVPGGTSFIYDGVGFTLVYDGSRVFPAAIRPFRRNALAMNASEIVLRATVPAGIPRGVYSFSLFMVRAGTDPLNPSNWLSVPGQATFNF